MAVDNVKGSEKPLIRHQPAVGLPLPSNSAGGQGAVPNVGADAGDQIRPQPAVGVPVPSNPAGSQGVVPNVGSGVEGPVVRGGTDMPTSAGQ